MHDPHEHSGPPLRQAYLVFFHQSTSPADRLLGMFTRNSEK